MFRMSAIDTGSVWRIPKFSGIDIANRAQLYRKGIERLHSISSIVENASNKIFEAASSSLGNRTPIKPAIYEAAVENSEVNDTCRAVRNTISGSGKNIYNGTVGVINPSAGFWSSVGEWGGAGAQLGLVLIPIFIFWSIFRRNHRIEVFSKPTILQNDIRIPETSLARLRRNFVSLPSRESRNTH